MKLNIYDSVPKDLYECDVKDIHDVLGGPSILHLKGKKPDAVFLGSLLHGNETTSFLSIQKILNNYKEGTLPRDLIIFFGNTIAASHGLRHLPKQPDFNRIWEEGDTPEHGVAFEVINYVKEYKLFAALDIHNNSGKNPFYGCINYTKPKWIELAGIFSKQIVYFTEPSEVLSNAMSEFCPSVTIEAGLPGEAQGIEEVCRYINTILELESFSSSFTSSDYEVYHTIGRIMIDKDSHIDFENSIESKANISFIPEIDEQNFELIKKNTHFGYAQNLDAIKAVDNNEKDITKDIFSIIQGSIQSNRMFIPAMFTKDIYIMKEDCMGYIMEKMIPLK